MQPKNPVAHIPTETVKILTNLQVMALLRNGEYDHPNYNFGNQESADFNANFAPEVQETVKIGKPTLKTSRDGNLETGDTALSDSQNSRSRTGVPNEKDDDDGPQDNNNKVNNYCTRM